MSSRATRRVPSRCRKPQSHIAQSKRDEFFDASIRLATRQRLRTTTNSNEQFTHKLGGFRMNGTPRDSRGEAVLLTAALAEEEDQRERVRRLAYSLLGQESHDWPTPSFGIPRRHHQG